jgi:hypothetical protein
MATHYANALRTHSTPEEVVVDFGFNLLAAPPTESQSEGVVHLKMQQRIIMNYSTAKRLTLTIGNIVRAYEAQFGEIPLTQARQTL